MLRWRSGRILPLLRLEVAITARSANVYLTTLGRMIMTVTGCLMLFSSSEHVLCFSFKVVIIVFQYGLIVLLHVYDGRAGGHGGVLDKLGATAWPAVNLRMIGIR